MWSLIYLNMRKEAEPNKTKQKKLISLIDCEKTNFLCHVIVYGLITLVIKSMCRGLKLGKAAKLMKTQLKIQNLCSSHFFQSCPVDWIGVLTAYFSLHFSPHVRPWALCLTPLI